MTARPVAPVIPATSPGRRREGKPGAGRPMPLPSPSAGRSRTSTRIVIRVDVICNDDRLAPYVSASELGSRT